LHFQGFLSGGNVPGGNGGGNVRLCIVSGGGGLLYQIGRLLFSGGGNSYHFRHSVKRGNCQRLQAFSVDLGGGFVFHFSYSYFCFACVAVLSLASFFLLYYNLAQ